MSGRSARSPEGSHSSRYQAIECAGRIDDQKPVPKVIDFGVAKATNQKLTDKTIFTQFGQLVGTLGYMSPEQAKLNQMDIDTRCDIYSLGVLLYELLTGETPLDGKRLRSAQLMGNTVHDPRRRSPQAKHSNQQLPELMMATAAYRRAKPEVLASEIRGDLVTGS